MTCFLYRGLKLTVCGAETDLFCVWWSIDSVFVWEVVVEIGSIFACGPQIALVLVWASRLTWCSSGWSILTWFQCEGSNLTRFQFRDRNRFCFVSGGWKRLGFSIWIGIDLDFLWWCSTANRYGVLTYRCVGYVLEDWSFNVDWVLSSSVVYPF